MSQIVIEKKPDPEKLQAMGIFDWPIWEKEVSTFPWTYDSQETCYLLEGSVTVTPDEGEVVEFGAGDMVIFPAGMSCTWQIHSTVKKHYSFA